MLKFLIIVSSEGHVQFSHHFVHSKPIGEAKGIEGRPALESRVADLCLHQEDDSCHFIEDGDQMIVHRRFGPCLMAASCDPADNELFVYEFLNLFVSVLHKYFGKFSEKHVLFNVDRLHMVLEEMVVNGDVVESSSKSVLGPLLMLDNLSSK